MYLKPVEDLFNINRICEQRIENGENPEKVAKFYIKEKEKLQQAQLEYERRFRSWIKNKIPQDEIELLNDEKKNDTEINDNETNAKKGSKNGNSNSIKRKNKTNNKTRKKVDSDKVNKRKATISNSEKGSSRLKSNKSGSKETY